MFKRNTETQEEARKEVVGSLREKNIFRTSQRAKREKAALIAQGGLCNLIPAVTYVPTQLPVQYHRPGEA